MAQNCHPTNPTGTFAVQSSVTNNSKGMMVQVSLPTDQNKYEVDAVTTKEAPGNLSIDIVLKASQNPTSGTLDVQVNGYQHGPQGNLATTVHLFVFENEASVCKKKKKEDKPIGNCSKAD